MPMVEAVETQAVEKQAIGTQIIGTQIVETQATVAEERQELALPKDFKALLLLGMRGTQVVTRADGTMLALFESQYWVQRLEQEQPDLLLEPLVAEGRPG